EPDEWEDVGSVNINKKQDQAMRQAWRLCRWVTSNAAVIGTVDQALGVGAGQQSRVDAVDVAVRKVNEFHDDAGAPIVMASDGFFPFPDNIERAHEAGVDAIVSPGGSVRDDEVLAERDIAMVFTHTRAFYH
ncbi:MAG: phosphoribosylglycinamide formyltransferase, partial [bacterium]